MNTVYALRRAGSARMTPMASALALTLFSGLAVSVTPQPMLDGPGALTVSSVASPLMDSPAFIGTALYTIVFKEAPVATYAGETAGYARPQRLLQGASTGKLDIQASTTVAYTNYLQNQQDVAIAEIGTGFGRSIDVRARMQHALNAVIVELTSSEAAAINQRADVEFVEREHQLELHTDNSGGFIGAPSIYDGFTSSGAGSKGEGIVVGIIDTGINWQSPAYAAVGPIDGYVHINPRGTGNYLGLCQAGQTDEGRCNDKLIGMYNFALTAPTRSGVDTQGHGSHTSSTAAGNRWTTTFANGPFTVEGIAPHANVIAYLACPSTCPSTATSQSANQAVIDGVDVINYSISGGTSPWTDATSTAFRNANAAGVFVAASAGNTSATVTNPVGQVNHLEPWVETVAASTQNRMIGVPLDLDGGPANTQDIPLRTGGAPLPTAAINAAPIIKSPNFADGSNDGCAAYPANFFTRPFSQPAEYIFADGFDDVAPPTTQGGIAVLRLGSPSNCASGARRTAALAAGAIGVIFVDTNYLNLGASGTSWSMLLSDWNILEAAYTPATATASIDITARTFPAVGDRVADFSFRGPRLVSGQGIIKPDITGPGVDILAAGAANVVGVNGVYLSNGTSMSSPHMAGAAALMRAINPSWTPSQIKSAMNMSSNNFGSVNQDGSPVTLWDYGSGRVNLTAAAKVGLIMDETPANFLAANPATGGDVSTLNLANISKYNIVGSQVFTRTFRRARAGSQTYNLAVTGLPAAAVSVSPASFFINSSGSATVTVTVNSAMLTEAQWTLGELLVTPAAGDEPNLHLPIAVYPGGPQIAVSPPALSGTSDTTVSNDLTITNTANPTLNWMFQTTGTAVVTPFNAPVTTNGQLAGYYVGLSQGYHWSQNFDIRATTHVTTLRANGFTLPSTTALTATNTPQVIFSVYADNAGSPAGAPEGFGSAPLWTHSATISAANGITTTGGAISLNLNAANVVGNPLDLPPGRYWMTVSPRINGTAQQTAANPLWAWYVSDGTPVGNVPRLYAPWSDPLAFAPPTSGLNMLAGFVQGTVSCALPSWVNLTTTSGALGAGASQAVPVVFNAAGLDAGVYSGALCVTSNATNTPVVSVPLTFTVPNGGSMAPTISKAFAPGSVAANVDSTLTITLSNANAAVATLTSALTDTFPAGLVVAPTPAESTTCPSGVVTATAGSGLVSLASGAQIPASGSCTVAVNVRSATADSYLNTIAAGALVTDAGNNAAAATATLTVTVAPITYTVTPSVTGGNGSIAPSVPQTVNSGATTAFTLTPDSGFAIGPVTGSCGGSLSGSSYTTDAVIADCTVIASFTPVVCTTSQPIEVKATGATAGPTGYATLKAAFDAVNAGTHTGVIDVSVCGDTTETASASLNATGTTPAIEGGPISSYTSMSIKPANGAARTISGDLAAPLVNLNGADNVTIDGLNTGGNSLTIANTNTGILTTTSTIRFIAGATGNTVTNASLQGSATMTLATNGGVVFFSTGDNDNNTISNNNIGPAGTNLPTKLVYGNGSTTTPNDNITIDNNNLFDFFSPTTSVAGVYANSGNNTWTINNNRIYQTAARTFTGTGLRYAGITLSTTATPYGAFTVTNNTIGFGAANGTGTTTISGSTNLFRGLDVISVDTAIATSLQGNVISGINQTSTSTGAGSTAPFIGIMVGPTRGLVNAGDVAGNTIGSLDGTSTIVLNLDGAGGGSSLGMYQFSGSSVNMSNNNVGAITIQGTGTTASFTSVYANSVAAATATLSNNTVGGPTTAGAITSLHTGLAAGMFGVRANAANAIVTGNTVQNMIGSSSNAGFISASGVFVTNTSTNPSTIRGNTVHSLTNNSAAANTSIYAIYTSLGLAANVVERNLVHSLLNPSTNAGAQIAGIVGTGTASTTTTFANNMVRIGLDASGASITNNQTMYGMFEIAGTNNVYNNSVYVGGTGVTASTAATYAFVTNVSNNTRNYVDNIFWNARSNATAGGGFHVAALYGGNTVNPTGLTANYNDIYATGTDGFVGVFNATAYPTLASFQAATGQDANSFSSDPQFIAPNGDAATGNLHIHATNPTQVEGTGTPIATVTDDFDGEARAGLTPTDVGADAGNFVAFVPTTYTVTPSAGANGAISPNTAQTVNSGATTAFTLTPNAGFAIGPVTGTCPAGSLSGSTYTTGAITADCTVIASFTQITYTVTPSVGTGTGTIAPSTPQTVNSGATQAFTLTPASGFAIGTTTGTCGGSLSGSVYTTNAVNGDCTVVANFTQITYTVTPSAGANGAISPNTAQTVNSGATTAFTLTPDSGFAIGPVTGTCPAGSLSGSTYTTGAITADCTVVASFTQITYTVTPSVGSGASSGTITPDTPQTVNSGATTAFTLAPAAGYSIGTVGGTCGGNLSGATYTTAAVIANCTVIANFVLPACPVQNFDAETAPALPAEWIATTTGTGAWTTVSTVSDTAPNSAFAPDLATVNDIILTTPLFAPAANNAFKFRNRYTLENGFDGAVLEISINGGAFQDIVAAGGSFVAGGYNGTLSTNATFLNPLVGRPAWTGTTGTTFVDSIALFPPSAIGQPTQLRFRLGSDSSTAGTGWWVDTVTCGPPPPAVTKAFSPTFAGVGTPSTLTLSLTSSAAVATLTADLVDTLPTNVTVATTPNASTTCPTGVVTAVGGASTITLGTGAQIPTAGCSVTVSVQPDAIGIFTNTIAAGALQTDIGNSLASTTATLRGVSATPVTYNTGFESPFTVGNLGTQQGWSVSGTAAQTTISTLLPAAGTQHLRLLSTTGTGATVIAAFSPTKVTGVGAFSTLSAKVRIDSTGAGTTFELVPQDPLGGFVNSRLRFDRAAGRNIQIQDFTTGLYVNTGASWPLATYFDALLQYNRSTGTVQVCINGTEIYNASGAVSSRFIGNVFVRQAGQTGNTAGNTMNVDDLVMSETDTPATCSAPLPTVTKAFSPAYIDAAAPSTLTISLGNSASTANTLTSALTDTFPSGMVVAPTPGAATNCPSGSVTAVAGSGSVSLNSGAQIPPGGCAVTVSVQSATNQDYVNTIPVGGLQTSNGANATAANASLFVGNHIVTVSPNLVVPANGDGVYFDFLAGTNATTQQTGSSWNPYGSTNLTFFWANSGTIAGAGVSAIAGGDYTVLQSGATISSSSLFSTTSAATNFRQAGNVDGYLGIRFTNTTVSPGLVTYGYVHMTTTGTTGHPATVLSYTYDRRGIAITIP